MANLIKGLVGIFWGRCLVCFSWIWTGRASWVPSCHNVDTEKEIRVGERDLGERGRYSTWWHTYLPIPKSYPRAWKLCEWMHFFWEHSPSSCLSLVSGGIQLPESCRKGRSETGVWPGVWKDALDEAHRALQKGSASSHTFIQTMAIEIYLLLLLMPRNGSQCICEFYLKSATDTFIWVRIKSRIMNIQK